MPVDLENRLTLAGPSINNQLERVRPRILGAEDAQEHGLFNVLAICPPGGLRDVKKGLGSNSLK
jgi:hypothetical protein